VLSDHYQKLSESNGGSLLDNGNESDEAEDFVLKRADHGIDDGAVDSPSIPFVAPSKKQLDKAREKDLKARGRGEKFHFDDDGNTISSYALESLEAFEEEHKDVVATGVRYGEELRAGMEQADVADKARAKERRKEEKRERKRKMRALEGGDDAPVEKEAVLGGGESDDGFVEETVESDGDIEAGLDIDMNESGGESIDLNESGGEDIDMNEREEEEVVERPAKKAKKGKRTE
jgi:ATP-dependent RNA helicase DDX10/DBP4